MSKTCKSCLYWEFELEPSSNVCGDVYGCCAVYCGLSNKDLDRMFGTTPDKDDWPGIIYQSKSDYSCKAFAPREVPDG
jgi:hypothetical protein